MAAGGAWAEWQIEMWHPVVRIVRIACHRRQLAGAVAWLQTTQHLANYQRVCRPFKVKCIATMIMFTNTALSNQRYRNRNLSLTYINPYGLQRSLAKLSFLFEKWNEIYEWVKTNKCWYLYIDLQYAHIAKLNWVSQIPYYEPRIFSRFSYFFMTVPHKQISFSN